MFLKLKAKKKKYEENKKYHNKTIIKISYKKKKYIILELIVHQFL